MRDSHIPDRDLLLAADGELGTRRAAEVQQHLAACWTCRTRMKDLEVSIGDFVHAHQSNLELRVPPIEGPRALLRARLAEISQTPEKPARTWHWVVYAATLCVAIFAGWMMHSHSDHYDPRVIPNPRLTPGATLPVSQNDVCTQELGNRVRFIPASMGQKVFQEYGIGNPGRRSYELDYLIAPELGGADDIRNFWPQPYASGVWNAHLKDALEDRLHQLVCSHQVSLATAQHDISIDWISAYKKYFHTDRPLPGHTGFTKDRPWEQ